MQYLARDIAKMLRSFQFWNLWMALTMLSLPWQWFQVLWLETWLATEYHNFLRESSLLRSTVVQVPELLKDISMALRSHSCFSALQVARRLRLSAD